MMYERVFRCCSRGSHTLRTATQQAFQGRHGRAYLFNNVYVSGAAVGGLCIALVALGTVDTLCCRAYSLLYLGAAHARALSACMRLGCLRCCVDHV